MHRLLATFIFAYAGLFAVQYGEAIRWLHAPPGTLWCGNVILDPYMLLVNVVAPLAAVANVALVLRSLEARRWPAYTITATLTFVATLVCMAYEGYVLRSEYNCPLSDVWWLPWV